MKQFEQQQTERSKRQSRIDIATEGEDINPMAPSSQDADGHSSRRGRVGSGVAYQSPEPPISAPPQPEFQLATPGQQFGFRLPEAAPQLESDTRAPPRTRFPGSSSTGSAPPSSRGPSLFSNDTLRSVSTAATSRTPSLCSSMDGRRVQFSRQRDSTSQRLETHVNATSQHGHEFDNHQPDPPPPSRLQWTTSFYNQPLHTNRTGHSILTAPELDDEGNPQIDEASPSKDERTTETNLRRADDSGDSAPHDNGRRLIWSPSLDDREQVPSRIPSQSRDEAAITHNGRNLAPDGDVGTDSAILQYQQSQHSSRPPSVAAPSQPQPNHVPRPSDNPGPKNVVHIHRRRNRAPHLPSNSRLLAARQQQQALSTYRATDEVQSNADGQDDPSTGHLVANVVERAERAEPWQLQYYDPPTRDVIERAKQFSHCDAASINPFPVRANFNSKAAKYIEEAIAERRSRGLLVSDGWWPQSAVNITRLLWEDLGSWRSALRKKARTFVTQRYKWDPENRRERNIEIAKTLLGNGGQFLRDGTDEEGRVNNLAHPALSGLIIEYFYTGPASIGQLFPEVFHEEVPRATVAIAATALKVVLDEVAAGQGEVNFRVATYSLVYTEILGLMNKCDTNFIHRDKTRALRRQWAEFGSNGMNNQEPTVGCGFDVDLN